MQVRVSSRVLMFLSGTGAWQGSPNQHPDDLALIHTIRSAPRRRDGSVRVELTEHERAALLAYAEAMYIGARDNMHDPGDALPDLRAASALISKLRTNY